MKLYQVSFMEVIDEFGVYRKDYRRIIVEAGDARQALDKVDTKENKLESIIVRELIETELYRDPTE